jgi:hypothetical protein
VAERGGNGTTRKQCPSDSGWSSVRSPVTLVHGGRTRPTMSTLTCSPPRLSRIPTFSPPFPAPPFRLLFHVLRPSSLDSPSDSQAFPAPMNDIKRALRRQAIAFTLLSRFTSSLTPSTPNSCCDSGMLDLLRLSALLFLPLSLSTALRLRFPRSTSFSNWSSSQSHFSALPSSLPYLYPRRRLVKNHTLALTKNLKRAPAISLEVSLFFLPRSGSMRPTSRSFSQR